MTSVVVLLILLAVVVFAARSLIKSHKNGQGCSGDCSNCHKCGH